MNITLLSGLIFVAVFAGVVFIHEFGHFIVSKLLKVEVEEFGFGFPPRMLTLWRQKGYLLLKSGQRLEIPRSFGLSGWSAVLNRELKITADREGNKLILRTLEWTEAAPAEKNRGSATADFSIDSSGRVIDKSLDSAAERKVTIGSQAGALELNGIVAEAHPGTEFTLNWLPLGGFVRPKGENDPTVPGGLAASSPWTRLAVLFAGPTMNLLLGVIVFSFLFFQMGVPDYSKVQIQDVLAGSPAQQAGIQVNDVVIAANGVTITDATQLHDIIYSNLDKPVLLTLKRGNQTINVTVTPLSSRPQNAGAIGISMGPMMVQSGSVIESLQFGALAVYEQTRALILLPSQMLRGQVSSQDSRFIGLKGIYDLFGQAVSRDVQSREPTAGSPSAPTSPQTPTYFTIQLIGILTISLGVLNLFPFPALDGGRIIFVLPELIIRKRIPTAWENSINAIGMAILLLFMLYVNVMDFVNPAVINLPK